MEQLKKIICNTCGKVFYKSYHYFNRAKKHYCSDKCRYENFRKNNPIPKGSKRPLKWRRKQSKLLKHIYKTKVKHHMIGSHRTEATKRKLSRHWKKRYKEYPKHKLRVSKSVKKFMASDLGKIFKKNISKSHKELWNNPLYFNRNLRNRKYKQNIYELECSKFLKQFGYSYVGDGSFWIGRKNPDFINKRKMKVIELYGSYYHSIEDVIPRMEYLNRYGWGCLIIWDFEFKDKWKLLSKVGVFNECVA